MNYSKINQPSRLLLSGLIFCAFAVQNSNKINISETGNSWVSMVQKAPEWVQDRIQTLDFLPHITLQDNFDPTKLAPEQYSTFLASPKGIKLKETIGQTYKISDDEVTAIVKSAFYWSNQQGLSPDLILGIIEQESSFNSKAKSSMGAMGLMQVIPYWHQQKIKEAGGSNDMLWKHDFNIQIGTQIIKEYIIKSRGNVREALLRYNGSLQNPNGYSEKVLKKRLKYKEILGGSNI